MKTLYTITEGDGRFPLPNLGYEAGRGDPIVAPVHTKLNADTAVTADVQAPQAEQHRSQPGRRLSGGATRPDLGLPCSSA